jgi:hypothetical protein
MSMIWKQYTQIADEVINQAYIVGLSSTAHRLSRRSTAQSQVDQAIVIQLKGQILMTAAKSVRRQVAALRLSSVLALGVSVICSTAKAEDDVSRFT